MEDVMKLLRGGWSPEQISGWRKRMGEGSEQDSRLTVSHDEIYHAICASPSGKLRRELIAFLRQGKPHRGRRSKSTERRVKIVGMANIKERPQDVWFLNLVERTSRLVLLVHRRRFFHP